MEVASVPGAPAAAEPAQPVAPTEPAAQPTAPAPAAEPTPGQPAAPAQDDVAAQLAAMQKRLDDQEAAGQPQAPADLSAALAGQPQLDPNTLAELGFSPEEIAAIMADPSSLEQGQPAAEPQQQQQQLAELDSYVNERISAAVQPLAQERQDEQLRGLQTKYPDITEPDIFSKVESSLEGLVQRYGNEGIKTDPTMVEMVYKAVKAELADTGAVSAEQAATEGASLETQAGQTQVGDSTPEQQYTESLLKSRSGTDAFT